MERIAIVFRNGMLYRSPIILTLAALAAVFGFLALYLKKSDRVLGAFAVVPLALALSLLFGRIIDWYCYEETYAGFLAAVTDFSAGGFALLGCFGGCLLAAVLIRVLKLCDDLPLMLDCMAVSGGAGIAVGRLASFFNSTDRGQIVESIGSMPWVYPVTNSVSGELEYRLATFLLQAMVTGVIVLVLLVFFLKSKNRRSGDTTLLFLLCYGGAQVVLDSTRYDSIYFHSNGFISIVQVMSALAIGFVIAVFSIRLVKAGGFKKGYVLVWIVIAALIGGAGYMEYHVQRHGNEALFAYTVMSTCLLLVVGLTVFIRHLSNQKFNSKN